MTNGIIGLLLFAAVASASDAHIRAQVFVTGDDQSLTAEVRRDLMRSLEETEGVITIGKEPDYIVEAIVKSPDNGGAMVAISVIVVEVMEDKLADRMLIRTDYRNETESVRATAKALWRTDHIDLRFGSRNSIAELCKGIVADINSSTFDRERKNPRGGGFDAAWINFLVRMGAKPVIQKPQ